MVPVGTLVQLTTNGFRSAFLDLLIALMSVHLGGSETRIYGVDFDGRFAGGHFLILVPPAQRPALIAAPQFHV